MIVCYFGSNLVDFHLRFVFLLTHIWPICCDFVVKKSAATFSAVIGDASITDINNNRDVGCLPCSVCQRTHNAVSACYSGGSTAQ